MKEWIEVPCGILFFFSMLIVGCLLVYIGDSNFRQRSTKEILYQSLKDGIIYEDVYYKEIILEKDKATSCGPDGVYGTEDDIVVRRYIYEKS
jgi:hypothetical protein